MSFQRSVCTTILITAISLLSHAQTDWDSISLVRDSIQDLKIEKLDLEQSALEKSLKANKRDRERMTDSLFQLNRLLRNDVKLLDDEKNALIEDIKILQEKIEIANKNSEAYKTKLTKIFRLAGIGLLLLVITIFILLFILNHATRKRATEQISGLGIQVKSELILAGEELREEHNRELKVVRKKLRQERQKEMKVIRRKIRKEVRNDIKERVRKIGKRKRKPKNK